MAFTRRAFGRFPKRPGCSPLTSRPTPVWPRVERAEAALMEMGFSDLRVRIRGGLGLIQLPGAQLERAMEIREQILGALGRDFEQVALDLNPRPKEK